jgi:RNA processing factor Prp31
MNTHNESDRRLDVDAQADLLDAVRTRIGAPDRQQTLQRIIDCLQRVHESHDTRQQLEDSLVRLLQDRTEN